MSQRAAQCNAEQRAHMLIGQSSVILEEMLVSSCARLPRASASVKQDK